METGVGGGCCFEGSGFVLLLLVPAFLLVPALLQDGNGVSGGYLRLRRGKVYLERRQINSRQQSEATMES